MVYAEGVRWAVINGTVSTCNCTLDLGEGRLLVFQKPAKEGVPFMMSSHFLLNGTRKKKPGFQFGHLSIV